MSPPPSASSAQARYERDRFRVQPGRIEDYRPGRCSVNSDKVFIHSFVHLFIHQFTKFFIYLIISIELIPKLDNFLGYINFTMGIFYKTISAFGDIKIFLDKIKVKIVN